MHRHRLRRATSTWLRNLKRTTSRSRSRNKEAQLTNTTSPRKRRTSLIKVTAGELSQKLRKLTIALHTTHWDSSNRSSQRWTRHLNSNEIQRVLTEIATPIWQEKHPYRQLQRSPTSRKRVTSQLAVLQATNDPHKVTARLQISHSSGGFNRKLYEL